jgi:hypothetical protein
MTNMYALSPYSRPLHEAAFGRQHYEAIAKILKDAMGHGSDSNEAVEDIANKFADLFARDNPRFDRGFFLNKCR